MPAHLHDEPTLDDQLARTELVRRIGDHVSECQAPAVFGIHGDWGSGKTTFLYLLQYYLSGGCPQCADQTALAALEARVRDPEKPLWQDWREKGNVAVVWFEAWRYQHEPAPVVALLQEIRAQLPTASKALASAKKLGEIAVKSALFNLDHVTRLIGFQASKVEEVAAKWEKDHLAEALPSHTLHEFLKTELGKLLPRPQRGLPDPRLLILIDDLDRCESQAAYKLLEGIKIYLNLPNCVFVLGVNQSVIEDSLASQIKTGGDARFVAREYLEKICRNFWHLPSFPRVEDLLSHWLNKSRAADGGAAPGAIDSTLVGVVAKITKNSGCLPANPRKVKAFVNTLVRFLARDGWNKYDAAKDPTEVRPKLCVLLAYLYQFHPEIYRILEWDATFYKVLHKWCADSAPPAPTAPAAHEAFRGLLRVDAWAVDPQAPTPGTAGFESAYPDPARGNYMRASALVRELDVKKLGQHVNPAAPGNWPKLIEDCVLEVSRT